MSKGQSANDLHQENTGCAPADMEHSTIQKPLSCLWMSDALIERTQRVWGRLYGREINMHEAMKILDHVKGLAGICQRLAGKGGQK